ncbi:MAG: hypothetical protein M1818_005040 [Claussenomyces sp. TS43310]|nr:MAG: hypothetical protein M1818_005040 [Claussenomyces sp. TS43310]
MRGPQQTSDAENAKEGKKPLKTSRILGFFRPHHTSRLFPKRLVHQHCFQLQAWQTQGKGPDETHTFKTDRVSSAVAKFIALTKQSGHIDEQELEKVFEKLAPVSPDVFVGEWQGHSVDTGHPGVAKNKELRWAGKTFRGVDDVDPMVALDANGKRVWMEEIGHARLREVKYKGLVSTAMIYNQYPIIDHFRRINDTTVAGCMDTPLMPEAGIFYFYLTKL